MTPTDIACEQLVELLTEYLEGTLAPDDVAAIDEHLRGCKACRCYVAQMHATITALGSVQVPTLSDEACDALLAAFTGNDPTG